MAKNDKSEPTAEELLVDDLADKERNLSARESAMAEEAARLARVQQQVEVLAAKVEAKITGTQASAEQRLTSTVARNATGEYRVYFESADYGNWQVVVDHCCDPSEAVRCGLAARNISDTHNVRYTVEKLSA